MTVTGFDIVLPCLEGRAGRLRVLRMRTGAPVGRDSACMTYDDPVIRSYPWLASAPLGRHFESGTHVTIKVTCTGRRAMPAGGYQHSQDRFSLSHRGQLAKLGHLTYAYWAFPIQFIP